jgi:hypothetical protein
MLLRNAAGRAGSVAMSKDAYQPDSSHHGGGHIDRYTKNGQLVGRYHPDGRPIRHKGVVPPLIPTADQAKFAAATARLRV